MKKFFLLPDFHDEDKQRTGQYLNTIIWSSIALLSVFYAYRMIQDFNFASPTNIFLLVLVAILIILRVVLQYGFVRPASFFLITITWVALTYQAYSNDGIRDITITAYIVLILMASLLLGWRYSFLFFGLSIAAMWSIAIVQQNGMREFTMDTPVNIVSGLTIIYSLILVLSYLIVSSLQRSLQDARSSAYQLSASNKELQALQLDLEKRILERTQSLELASEVGRSIAQMRQLNLLLKDAAEIIRSRFDLYYTQIYLTTPSQTELLLQAGTGTVGEELLARGHSLPLNTTSINGRAALDKNPVVISNTTTSAFFRPNPLLPETRSEVAVPLMVGENVVGVLDLQSNETGALDVELLPAFQALAGQLAIAIQNAKLLTETEEARAEVEKQARHLVRTGWNEYLDAIHKPEQTGFVFEKNEVQPLAENDVQPPAEGNAISTPIAITGEQLGSLVVELSEINQTPQNAALIQSVARQVAQQIENLRLLESAERYRAQAEETVRHTTIEGWKQYLDTKKSETLSFLYNTKEVRPRSWDDGQQTDESAVTFPIKAREETVGKLSISGIESQDTEKVDLINAIAERLGAHIEGLRLSEQTAQALVQTEQLSRQNELILGAVGEGIFGLDLNGNHTFVNEAAAEMLGFATDELISRHSHTLWHHSHADGTPYPGEECPIYFTLRDGEVHQGDEYFLRKDGSGISVSFTSTPIREGDDITGAVVTFIDITERKATEERIRRQAEHETLLNVISQKIQSATSVEAVLQIAARELGHALGAPLTIAQLGMKEHDNGK